MKIDIFPFLVEHHYQRNLVEISNGGNNGELLGIDGMPLQEGSDERTRYSGFLFLVDGSFVLEELKTRGIILDNKRSLEYSITQSAEVPTKDEFLDYLRKEEKKGQDGAYVFNSSNGKLIRIHEFNNNPELPEEFEFNDYIPLDFTHYKSKTREGNDEIGTKTRVAIKIPVAMKQKGKEVHAYQIKRTPFTEFGMGKVTHFDYNGLNEEFFFVYENGKVLGVYREYSRRENGLLYKSSQEIMELDKLQRFCESLNQFKQVA